MMKMIKYIYYFLIYLTNYPLFSFIVNTCEECGKSSFSSFLRIFWFSPPPNGGGFSTGFLLPTHHQLEMVSLPVFIFLTNPERIHRYRNHSPFLTPLSIGYFYSGKYSYGGGGEGISRNHQWGVSHTLHNKIIMETNLFYIR